jgi:ElaB/YqjD/DUF883 family membrane-anchored ribosome-binding protein
MLKRFTFNLKKFSYFQESWLKSKKEYETQFEEISSRLEVIATEKEAAVKSKGDMESLRREFQSQYENVKKRFESQIEELKQRVISILNEKVLIFFACSHFFRNRLNLLKMIRNPN